MSTLKVNTIQDASGNNGTTPALLYNGTAKAWVNFNGTGTVAIRASYNVTSITDNGVGDYTVNFTNALVDANYVLSGSALYVDDSQGVQPANVATPFTSTTARIYTLTNSGLSGGGIVSDCTIVSAAFLR